MGLFDFLKKKAPSPLQSGAELHAEAVANKERVDARMAEYHRLKKVVEDNPPGRELDLRIAQEVTRLPNAGHWNRSGWTTVNWERCGKDDAVASVCYNDSGRDGALAPGGVMAIPYYSTDANEMMALIDHLVTTRHARVTLSLGDESDVSISAGDCNCPHSKEYDPDDGHGWTYIDEVLGKTPMHAVAVAALEFCKKVKAEKQKERAA
jgi:hypothetical protein